MQKKKNIPALRFRGFCEEWEEDFVEGLCSISTGNSNTQDNVKDGQYPFYVRSATIEKSNKYLFDEEAVLTVGDGVGTGKVYHYVNGKYDLHQRVYRMYDFTDIKGKLFYYIFSENFQERVSSMTAKSSVDSVRMEMISKMKISRPNKLEEQTKIGSFFENLDQLLTKHQTQHQKLQALKKAMLSKLFPKKGATTPEIRFKGFTGDWEEEELQNQVDFFTGLTYSPNNVTKNGTFVIRSSNVKNGHIVKKDNVFVKPEIVNCDNVQKGDIVVVVRNGSRNLIGKHAQIKNDEPNTVIGAFMTGIRTTNSNYVTALLDTDKFKEEINRNLGATINQITTGHFKKMNFCFPTKEEQQQIGNYFKNLDALITKHATQIEKLGAIKKACLSKMFV